MLITDKDNVLTAKEAYEMAQQNKDDSRARYDLREAMAGIRFYASVGYTERTFGFGASPRWELETIEELRKFGFEVEEIKTETVSSAYNQYTYVVKWGKNES